MPNPLHSDESGSMSVDKEGRRRMLAYDEEVSDTNRYCNLHGKFSSLDMDCLFLNNAGNLGLQILLLIIFKALIRALARKSIKSSTQADSEEKGFQKGVSKINNYISFAFIIEFLQAMHLDFIMAAYINMRNLWLTPFTVWINSTISIIVWISYLYLIITILNKSKHIELLKQK